MREAVRPRERVLRALSHREADRPAFAWGFGPQPPARAALNAFLGQWDLDYDALFAATSDVRRFNLAYAGPPLPPRTSPWGWTVKPTSYGIGSYDEFDHQPLATAETVADVESHPWPDPDHFDYAAVLPAIRQADPDRRFARVLGGGNPLETLSWMMGLQKTLVFLLDRPDVIRAAMERIVSFYESRLHRVAMACPGEFDTVFCADDLGTQHGPMIGRSTYREIIMPYHRRMCAAAREVAPFVQHHSDGSVAGLLDDLIEAGVDCLEAVQVDCADMDPEGLKARFGDRLAFQGAVSVQQVLPRQSAPQVREEVRRLKRILGAGGGYICAPSHAVQAGTPPENVVAMVEEAVECSIEHIAAG